MFACSMRCELLRHSGIQCRLGRVFALRTVMPWKRTRISRSGHGVPVLLEIKISLSMIYSSRAGEAGGREKSAYRKTLPCFCWFRSSFLSLFLSFVLSFFLSFFLSFYLSFCFFFIFLSFFLSILLYFLLISFLFLYFFVSVFLGFLVCLFISFFLSFCLSFLPSFLPPSLP